MTAIYLRSAGLSILAAIMPTDNSLMCRACS